MLRSTIAVLILLAIGLPSFADAPADPQILRYTIASNGKTAGSEVDSYFSDGRIEATFEFNDRGRGPKIFATYQLDANGLPLRIDETGNDYLKAPVDEHFLVKEGKATWKSTAEKGEAAPGAFYISNNGTSAELAFLVAALQKANGKPLRLLPAGEARLERLTDLTLEDHGQKIHVVDYAITGLSFEPQTIWLDDQNRFFGFPGTWFSILRKGWEKTNDQLYAVDTEKRDERYARLAKDLARRPTHPIAIEHVRLFDSEQASLREDQTVIVNGNRFSQVGPAGTIHVPHDAERIDGAGKTLLPGLFDVHAHAQPIDGILNIASGVTAVRDMGNNIDDLKRLQEQWQKGSAIGPRIWKAGFIDGHGEFQAPTGLYADTELKR